MTDDSDDERREAARELVDALWEPDEQPQQRAVNDDAQLVERTAEQRSRYVQRALTLELSQLAAAQQGERNDALNRASFNLGQLIGAGALDELTTRAALTDIAQRIGLDAGETRATIESGISKGQLEPRELSMTQLVTRNDTSSAAHPFGEVASSQQPPVEPPSDAELADFWESRALLAHVHQYARARLVAPWAVLGVVLARIVAVVPPTVVLPPIVGGQATLNIFVGLVGASGTGKGAAERVAAECLSLGEHITTSTTGSGEGIAHGFVKRLRDGTIEQHTTSVLFTVPEIDTLSALGARQGATLMPELRRAWSGEQLGFQYVDPTKRLIVAAHQYRMTLVAGIQPARAGALLDDSDGGTPQRFIWCSALDRDAPDEEPETPRVMSWSPPSYVVLCERDAFGSGRLMLHVCKTARDAIVTARKNSRRGIGDPLDGHGLLARLKVAAALTIADGRCDVSDDDWQLAGVVMKQSDATRAAVAQTLSGAARERNASKAEAEADRSIIVSDREHDAALRRACRAVLRKLQAVDEHAAPRRVLRNAVQHRDRPLYDEACATLVSSGQIEADLDRPGECFKLA